MKHKGINEKKPIIFIDARISALILCLSFRAYDSVKDGANAELIVPINAKIRTGICFVIDKCPIAVAPINRLANNKSNPCSMIFDNLDTENQTPDLTTVNTNLLLYKAVEVFNSGVRFSL